MNVCWIYCGQPNQISAADSPSVGSDQSQSVECPASSMTRRSDLTVAEWSPRRLGAVTVRQRATDVRFTGVGGVRTTGSLDRPSGRQMFGNSNARTGRFGAMSWTIRLRFVHTRNQSTGPVNGTRPFQLWRSWRIKCIRSPLQLLQLVVAFR